MPSLCPASEALRRLEAARTIVSTHHTNGRREHAIGGRRDFSDGNRGVLRRDGVARAFLFATDAPQRKTTMNAIYWLGGIAAIALFVYLVVALFRPELFS